MTIRGRLVAVLVIGAVALGGCGIPLSRTAEPVAAGNLPPELSGSTSIPTTTTTVVPVVDQHASHLEIFLVSQSGRLVGVRRSWEQHVTPLVALEVLALGPSSLDNKRGIETRIGPAPTFRILVGKGGIAAVTLDEATFGNLFGSSLYVPLAQIVYTLMADFRNLKGVDFYLGGQLFNYTSSGSSSPRPVTERTYASLAPIHPS